MSRTPSLETPRLLLRPYVEQDRAAFMALNGSSIVREHMDGPLTADAANRLFDRRIRAGERDSAFAWAVVDKADGLYIGHVFVDRDPGEPDLELGFMYFPRVWGRGYATEAAQRVIAFCFDEAGIGRLTATVDDDHAASIHLLEKAGFQFSRYERDENGPCRRYVLTPA